VEPVVDPLSALDLIREIGEYVNVFKVGKWNHDARAHSINWRWFGNEAVSLLKSQGRTEGVDYIIKDDLKQAML